MKTLVQKAAGPVLVWLLIGGTSFGHHSFAGQFDRGATMELEGTLVEVRWINPHAHIVLEATEGGETVTWDMETAGATQLVRSGVEREFFNVGDRVRVVGNPPVTSTREIHATNLLLPNGTELILARGSRARFADQTAGDYGNASQRVGDSGRPDLGLFRIWSFTSVSPFLFPEDINANYDLERYPLTDAARGVIAEFDRAADNPILNCTPKGMPTIMEQPYPMMMVERPDSILVYIEEYDLIRTVYMDRDGPPEGQARTPLGYSVGRWDGDTLVVTTTHVSWPWMDQVGIGQSDQARLVERYTPTADGSRLDYTLTITDPVYLTAPVELSKYWLYLPGEELMPYDCVPE